MENQQQMTVTGHATPMSLQSLTAKLQGLLASTDSPIVGPDTAKQLRAFAATPEPDLPANSDVEIMIGKLAMATAQAKVSKQEANERLEMYWLALRDIPTDDLRSAFLDLVRNSKFLPTPAEVRAAALRQGAPRRHAKSRARYLAFLHDRQWQPPQDYVPADELAGLLAGVKHADAQSG